jgi:hypothetical protein
MIRVVRVVIVSLVAAKTGIWCCIVIAIVAVYTIQGSMSSCNHPIGIVVGKKCRIPTRCRGVTACTVRRQGKAAVVWICGAVIVTLVAAYTGIRSTGIVAIMA